MPARAARADDGSMHPVVSLTCPSCGASADVAPGEWWTCACGRSVCGEAPDAVATALERIDRGHRVALVAGLLAVLVLAAVPGLVIDRGALLLAPLAAVGLFVGVVLPLARRRRDVAIGRIPGWHAGG